MKKNIIKMYLFASMVTGTIMGIIFPYFSFLFVKEFKSQEHLNFFIVACIVAGLIVG